MGTCNSSLCRSDFSKHKKNNFNRFMLNFGSKIQQSGLPMQFIIKLKTVKGLNVKEKDVYLDIDLFSFERIKTHIIYNTDKPKWSINKKINITINKLQDFDKILNIKLFSKKSKYLGNIELGFYELIVGTVRNNFVINSKSHYMGRLQFDLKISQIITMNIKIQKLKAEIFDFQNKFQDKDFKDFFFQVYLDNDSNIKSQQIKFNRCNKNIKSGVFHNVVESLDEYEFNWNSKDYSNSDFDIILSNDGSQIIAEEILTRNRKDSTKMLNISFTDEDENKKKKDLSSLKDNKNMLNDIESFEELNNNKYLITKTNGPTQILSEEIADSIELDFYLRTNKFPYTHLVFKIYDEESIVAVGYLPLDNYFHHKGNFIEKADKRNITTGFNIWKYGHYKGNIEIFIQFNYLTFFRQNKSGVRTEDGIFSSSNVLKFTARNVVHESRVIKIIKEYQTEFDELIFRMYNPQEDKSEIGESEELMLLKKFKSELKEHFSNDRRKLCKDNEIFRLQISLLQLYVR